MPARRPLFVIAGGGTGGHLYPGLAVATALRAIQPNFEVTIFGTPRPIDAQLADRWGFELFPQETMPFPRKPWEIFKFYSAWRRSGNAARERFAERSPAVVLGLGGYAAAPAILAASKLGLPTALFNPDAMPGRANKFLARKVDRVFVQWEATAKHFGDSDKVICTGCPIREEFATASREAAIKALKLDRTKKTLLITGASQGAHSINLVAVELSDLWRVAGDWQVVHLTGKDDLEFCRTRYKEAGVEVRTLAYTEHMALCMIVADLVLSRAGASTLAEVTAMGLPSVLMPYPFDRKKHQLANAKVLETANAAAVVTDVNDGPANAKALLPVLRDVMKSDQRRRRMSEAAGALGRHDAADVLANALYEMARRT